MKIGDIDLGDRPVMLAPMEDVTDQSFRLICREQGADMVYTEFVSADALIRSIERSLQKMAIAPGERPAAIQIYGRDVDSMVEAARIAATARPDFIDINWGCPVKKIAGKGSGAGMLRNIPLMLEITRAVVRAVDVPVTVKTRLGWDHNSKIIVELAEQLQDCGIAALTIHGRTRSQIYTGEADWTLIGAVKNNPRMTIPIIGNGDVTTPQRLKECYDEVPVISNEEKMALVRRQIAESIDRIDEYRGILHIRRHLAATPLFKGIRNFRPTRIAMLRADTRAELEAILDHIEKDILPNIEIQNTQDHEESAD